MKKYLSLEVIKNVEFDILKHFKEYCEKENIRYFLSNGTLLGAVKYKDFIPWDDDVDVLVPREDYNRLIEKYIDSDEYRLYSPERDSKFYYPFAKLCNCETVKEEVNVNNGVSLGLDIDIFPIDAWPDDDKYREKKLKSIQRHMNGLMLSKLHFNRGRNIFRTIIKNILICVYKCIGPKFFIKLILNEVENIRSDETKRFLGCVVWPIYGKKEIIRKEVFNYTVDVNFNSQMFPAPVGYDEYLRSLYGNYKLDPPKDKQKTHHNFKAYWKNDE